MKPTPLEYTLWLEQVLDHAKQDIKEHKNKIVLSHYVSACNNNSANFKFKRYSVVQIKKLALNRENPRPVRFCGGVGMNHGQELRRQSESLVAERIALTALR